MKSWMRWVVYVVVGLLCGLFLSFLVSCASLPLKQRAVVSLQSSETALEAAHDAERLLCSPTANPAEQIKVCNGPAAASIGLTSEKHQALAKVFSRAFDTQHKATIVLTAWRAGDPVPASLAEYRRDVSAVLVLVSQMIPDAKPVVSKVQQAVDAAAFVARLIGVQ